MALRGKKPQEIKKRLKAFFYGAAKVGKTTAAIQFPKPYVIDTEKGAENKRYVDLIDKQEGAIFQCFDFEDLLKEVKSLMVEDHPYKTLVIDPITTIYESLLDQSASKIRNEEKGKDGTEFGRHYGEANKQMKRLMNLLMRIDMNVIVTAHAKNEYGDNLVVLGQTFDGYKKLDYLFDLILQIQKNGKKRVALVKGTRLEGFEEGEVFEFNYEAISNKYSKEILEKETEKNKLATPEQIQEVKKLILILKTPQTVIDKWLTKTRSASLDEMDEIAIQKIIEHLNKQIESGQIEEAA